MDDATGVPRVLFRSPIALIALPSTKLAAGTAGPALCRRRAHRCPALVMVISLLRCHCAPDGNHLRISPDVAAW